MGRFGTSEVEVLDRAKRDVVWPAHTELIVRLYVLVLYSGIPHWRCRKMVDGNTRTPGAFTWSAPNSVREVARIASYGTALRTGRLSVIRSKPPIPQCRPLVIRSSKRPILEFDKMRLNRESSDGYHKRPESITYLTDLSKTNG